MLTDAGWRDFNSHLSPRFVSSSLADGNVDRSPTFACQRCIYPVRRSLRPRRAAPAGGGDASRGPGGCSAKRKRDQFAENSSLKTKGAQKAYPDNTVSDKIADDGDAHREARRLRAKRLRVGEARFGSAPSPRSVKSEAEPAVAQMLIRADVHAPPADVHVPSSGSGSRSMSLTSPEAEREIASHLYG
ncbi:uncharacterized protein LOC113234009 [Hyposmocoma kahamanoa]|uniref:uncharacterized protein LOC113234009 n=1 Tax=Hyposmocoma kahamanoa TaxID=1477025 RepID=UPI000E6D9087|nr:uncharacterized protein LOC113234009 [Hyposmocoma kahamanoa]